MPQLVPVPEGTDIPEGVKVIGERGVKINIGDPHVAENMPVPDINTVRAPKPIARTIRAGSDD